MKPANEILLCAHTCMKQMGGYQALMNNCQDFCRKLAKDLDCPVNNVVFTGTDFAAGVGVAAGVAAGAVGILSVAGIFLFKLVTQK